MKYKSIIRSIVEEVEYFEANSDEEFQKKTQEMIDERERDSDDWDPENPSKLKMWVDCIESVEIDDYPEGYMTEEEVDAKLREVAKRIPVANIPDPDGMTVAPASWRED